MIFLIGHRGVGKSAIIKDFKEAVDLDQQIGNFKEIQEIFLKKGEAYFRDLEKAKLNEVLKSSPSFVSLGAGFELDRFKFPAESKFIWVQRESDAFGRVFFDRPRLEKGDPIEEFLRRKQKRDKVFSKFADFKFLLPEGDFNLGLYQKIFKDLVQGKDFASVPKWFFSLSGEKEVAFSGENIELRTDVLSEERILLLLKNEKIKNPIVALRTKPSLNFLNKLRDVKNLCVDIAVELENFSDYLVFERSYLSCHERLDFKRIESFLDMGKELKWAPLVDDIDDLMKIHEFIKRKQISFLPRSRGEGKSFKWYRILRSPQNKINFFKFGKNDYSDQPSYLEIQDFLNWQRGLRHGAVLGGDVGLSFSPEMHRDFFTKNFASTYVAISLKQNEFTPKTLKFLKSLGIDFVSVTSPFKKEAGLLSGASGPVNSLKLSDPIKFANTDLEGLRDLGLKLKSAEKVLIWGSGALGQQIKDFLGGKAELVSVRDYQKSPRTIEADVVVWAAGLKCKVYPQFGSLRPKLIYDLDYKEQSLARIIALEQGCEYISGKDFFVLQGLKQQEFFISE